MAKRILKTFDAVITELGGMTAVAYLTARSVASVCNWRARGGVFPAALVDVIEHHLRLRGCTAARHLFRLDPVPPTPRNGNSNHAAA